MTSVDRRKLVDNRTIGCKHCGIEVLITRLPDLQGHHSRRPQWVLCPLMTSAHG